MRARRHQRAPLRRHLLRGALTLLLVCGAALTSFPLVQDLLWSQRAAQVVSRMSSQANMTHNQERMQVLRSAQAYNLALGKSGASLNNQGNRGSNEGGNDILCLAHDGSEALLDTYDQQLSWNGVAAICWLEIPALALREPVYHGTSEGTLAQGVGHLAWSSLPVGGRSSHCVLAAHSGMAEAQLFDELETLEPGTTFILHTLGDAYAYQVTHTEVVLPDEAAERCRIVPGEDLCTLITCTPYGVNTHRLLVHGRRVPYSPKASTDPPLSAYVNRRTRPLIGLGSATSLCAAGSVLISLSHRRRGPRRVLPAYCGWRHRRSRHP